MSTLNGNGYGNGDGDGYGYGYGYPEQEIGGPRVSLSTSAAREGMAGLTVEDALTFALIGGGS